MSTPISISGNRASALAVSPRSVNRSATLISAMPLRQFPISLARAKATSKSPAER